MKRIVVPLSLEERVQIELKAHRDENPGVPISVAEICRRADISRANLYEFHRPLVREIVGNRVIELREPKPLPELKDDAKKLSKLTKRNQALLLLCLELIKELQLTKARYEAQIKRRKR